MEKLEIKEINGYRYAVSGKTLFDTVPAAFSREWLGSAPEAEQLILCDADPFPESVKAFNKAHPRCRIIAPYYTAYKLKAILGDDFSVEGLRSDRKGDLSLSIISRPGKGSFLRVTKDDEMIWQGGASKTIEPAVYEDITVAICYTSGCDHTETMAYRIAEGIRDSSGARTVLIDLCSEKTEDVIAKTVNAAGILIGTSSEDGDAPKQVWDMLTAMNASLYSGKICGVFSSCTWDKGAAANVTERLRQLKMQPVDGGFEIQFRPDELAMDSIYEYGYDFGCRVENVPNTHRSKLVKCLVCGEIFDASLGVCPVCGVGMDKCIPVEDEVIGHKEDTEMTYLCIGGGIASLSAAEAIRRRDKTGRIIMVSKESSLPINRPMLTKNMVIAARIEDSFNIKTPEWFEENAVELRLNTSVTAIDPDKKTAVLSEGSIINYDRLIYAAGAECFIPPIEGKDLPGVFTIRHLSDVRDMWSCVGGLKKAVVIGGGVLGLEAAAELKKNRMNVTVLESMSYLMSRQIDEATSDAVIKAAEEYGITIHTGVTITEITGEGSVKAVKLDDGTEYPADIVVVSCGVRANLAAAETAGINYARAITVNDRMETNVPDIYAAGDCAEFEGVNYQLWAEASEQGRTAGANAAGDNIRFKTVPLGASFEGMNTALYALGDAGKGGLDYRIVEYRDEINNSFRRYWFAGGKIVGGILFGDTEKMQFLNEAVEKRKSYIQIKSDL